MEQLNALCNALLDMGVYRQRINAKVPSFKRIRSFTVRKDDFERTTAQKIKRLNNKMKGRLKGKNKI